MAKKSLKVDREKFEGIVKNLLHTKPVKREDVKIKNPKNRKKLIPPHANQNPICVKECHDAFSK